MPFIALTTVVIITIVLHLEVEKYPVGKELDTNIVRIVHVIAMFRVLLIKKSDVMHALNQKPVLEKSTGFGQIVSINTIRII